MQEIHSTPFGGSATESAKDWRRPVWLGLLILASVGFSVGFACATPFAAFAAASALTLPRKDALLLTGAVWLANQITGYGFLAYPRTANSFAWGAALGAAAILATLAAEWMPRRLGATGFVPAAATAFAAAFVVYEGVLLLTAVALLGDVEAFVPAIVMPILGINAAAFVGLLIPSRLGSAVGLAAPRPDALPRHA